MSSYTTRRRLYKPAETDYVNVLSDLSNNMENLDDALSDAMVAAPFDASSAYNKGDYVIWGENSNEGKIYRFTTYHPAATAWNLDQVEEVILTDRIKDHESRIATLEATGQMDNLRAEIIPGTVQNINFDNDGNVSTILHKKSGTTFRTDAFTFSDSTVTEVRTLATGEQMTIVTDTDTLETTITYSAA